MNKEKQSEPSLTIKKLVFNNGKEMLLNDDDIVIFVGPNNVGKSRALKDIRDDLIDTERNKVIIKEIEYKENNFNKENVKNFLKENYFRNEIGDYEVYIEPQNRYTYNKYTWETYDSNKREFYKIFFTFLSTENRLEITRQISYSNIRDFFAFNIMKRLEENLEEIEKMNEILLFGFNKAIDITEEYKNYGESKIYKIGSKEQIDSTVYSNSREAKQKLRELEDLEQQGDGIRSAVAILASLIVGNQSIYLIDEPEVFMHPPQARMLGNKIVELSENRQCFISTHNIDLIRGILEKSSSKVRIIKIERIEDNINEFYEIGYKDIATISNDRNLKYTNILNGLFYDGVVLCENESDCKFYSAILENLDETTFQNTLFCAVGGKDQFKVIIPLLQNLKINYKIIADIDLIDNKNNLKQLLNSIENEKYNEIKQIHKNFLEEFEKNSSSSVKKQVDIQQEINRLYTEDTYMPDETIIKIKNVLKKSNNFKLLKNKGKAILPQGECIIYFNEIEKFLNLNNIFILECGEIERFVPEINKHGNAWVEDVFNKYKDMNDAIYDDAKKFIRKVFNI